jgi:hypothetical protein
VLQYRIGLDLVVACTRQFLQRVASRGLGCQDCFRALKALDHVLLCFDVLEVFEELGGCGLDNLCKRFWSSLDRSCANFLPSFVAPIAEGLYIELINRAGPARVDL